MQKNQDHLYDMIVLQDHIFKKHGLIHVFIHSWFLLDGATKKRNNTRKVMAMSSVIRAEHSFVSNAVHTHPPDS